MKREIFRIPSMYRYPPSYISTKKVKGVRSGAGYSYVSSGKQGRLWDVGGRAVRTPKRVLGCFMYSDLNRGPAVNLGIFAKDPAFDGQDGRRLRFA